MCHRSVLAIQVRAQHPSIRPRVQHRVVVCAQRAEGECSPRGKVQGHGGLGLQLGALVLGPRSGKEPLEATDSAIRCAELELEAGQPWKRPDDQPHQSVVDQDCLSHCNVQFWRTSDS